MKALVPIVALAWLLLPGPAQPQTVYESKNGEGKTYSDRPLPGSKAVELRPLNVIEPLPVAPTAGPRRDGAFVPDGKPAPVATYRSLAVVFPEVDGSVAANYATFEVRVAVDPPLQVENGHAFTLRLDGRPVPGRYTATEMMIPPEFFGNVAPAGVQRHVLEASIVDAGGQPLLVASPVSFQTRFVTVLQRPRVQRLPPHPLPPSLPPHGRRGMEPAPTVPAAPMMRPSADGLRPLEPDATTTKMR